MITICTWIGRGEGCKHTVHPERNYCLEHLFVVYKEGSARKRRKKDEKVAGTVWDLESAMNEAVAELEAEGFDVWGDSERANAVPLQKKDLTACRVVDSVADLCYNTHMLNSKAKGSKMNSTIKMRVVKTTNEAVFANAYYSVSGDNVTVNDLITYAKQKLGVSNITYTVTKNNAIVVNAVDKRVAIQVKM